MAFLADFIGFLGAPNLMIWDALPMHISSDHLYNGHTCMWECLLRALDAPELSCSAKITVIIGLCCSSTG